MRSRDRSMAVTALVIALIAPSAAAAATATVDFDSLANDARVTDQYYANQGVRFPDGQFHPQVKAIPGKAHSGNNVAIYACEDAPGYPCGEGFSAPRIRGVLKNYASSVSLYAGYYQYANSTGTAQVALRAFNAAGTQIAQSPYVTVTKGQPFNQQLTVTAPASETIAAFEFVADKPGNEGAPVGFDDIVVTTPDAPQPPDFTLNEGDTLVSVLAGTAKDVPIDLNRVNGSNGDVTFSIAGLPAGMTAAFSPNPVPGATDRVILTLTAADDAVPTTAQVTITATPSSGAGATSRTLTKTVAIAENCERSLRMDYVDARASGCMTHVGSRHMATDKEVRINGLIVRPADDSRPTLVIDDQAKTIKGQEPTEPFAVFIQGSPDIPIYAGPINWSFGGAGGGPAKVVHYDNKYLKKIKGLPLSGFDVSFLIAGKSQITPSVNLNFWPFNALVGGISTTTQFVTDNDHGADFTGLDLKVGRVDAVALTLKDVQLHWHQGDAGDSWSGSAQAQLKFASAYTIAASFGIKNGSFDFLTGSISGLNVSIGAGVFLHGLGFEVHTNPLALQGSISLTAGPTVAGASAIGIDGAVKASFGDPWVIEVNGTVIVAGRYTIGGAYLRYSSNGLFEFGGGVDVKFWDLSINGHVDGWVAGLTKWNVEGSVKACLSIWGPDPCGDARLVVSTKGIGGCVGVFGYHVGAGTTWDPFDPDAFTGCDLSPYRETRPRGAGVPTTFTLPDGVPLVAWEIRGDGTVPGPGVTVAGPGGAKVTVSKDTPLAEHDGLHAEIRDDGTTFVLVKNPAAGTWTIAGDGTVPITAIRQARGLPQPSVKATVTGRGAKRMLAWKLRPIAGQRVTLLEVGKDVRRVIVADVMASGSRPFRPARGSGGPRRIVALVEQDGLPRTTLTAGRYGAPDMVHPGKPRALRVVRKGTRLTVRFLPHPAGFRHAVHLQLSDGRKLLRIVGARRHAVVFAGVGKQLTGTVTVRGLSPLNAPGPKAVARVKRVK